MLDFADRCPLGRHGCICTRSGSKPCPSILVRGGHYSCRCVSPTLCGNILILLLEVYETVIVTSFLHGLDTICVMSV